MSVASPVLLDVRLHDVNAPAPQLTVPLLAPAVKVTLVPATTLLYWSVTFTEGTGDAVDVGVPLSDVELFATSFDAASGVVVAVLVDVTLVTSADVAVSVLFVRTSVSNRQEVVTTPLAFVVPELGVAAALVPDGPTLKFTIVPLTGLPNASVTVAVTLIVAFAEAERPVPGLNDMFAGNGVPVAVNVTGVATPATFARNAFAPGEAPIVHDETAATPAALVVVDPGVTLPPPAVTVNVTDTPGTALPYWSMTFTDGGVDTFVPTRAD